MKFQHPQAEILVPDAIPIEDALQRTTHLGIGAHQDDLEFMALHGILECFQSTTNWFAGVICTDGAGSSRSGRYASCDDERMKEIRRHEQNLAARIGGYSAIIQLGHPSAAVKDPRGRVLHEDLAAILALASPRVIYTHNPADKHATHAAVTLAVIATLRDLPEHRRPRAVYGCEVWRDLDWLQDDAKVLLDVSGSDHLAAALGGVFDSQIAGGKRYDLAVAGRRRANATFLDSHAVDQAESVAFAIDLTPLVHNLSLDIADYVCSFIDQFRADVRRKLRT